MAAPRHTIRIDWRRWCGFPCVGLLFAAALAGFANAQPRAQEPAPEPRYFRIGTAATGGSFFEIGGIVASAVSGPTEGPPCGRGGTCGVPGLVAVAQATPGSIGNLRLIDKGEIESGFAQADLAGWAYNGVKLFADSGPLRELRAIASLFPAVAHLVVRADSPIRSLADLKGKTVAVGEAGSGSAADAAIVFEAAGLGGGDLVQRYLRPAPGAAELKAGTIDALFLVGGSPVPVIRDLAASTPIRLIPIEGEVVERLKKDFAHYQITAIPAGAYSGVETPTPSIGFSALWLTNSRADPDLVYAITKSLWNPATAKLLSAVEPIGAQIRLERALDGLSVPLHAGAARFYREAGLPVNNTPALPPETQANGNGTKEVAQDGRGKDISSEADAVQPKEP
ncbi:MAG: TAXI family TRAP transporter solute-binding subunit [Alphaproteobacteria bacterium]